MPAKDIKRQEGIAHIWHKIYLVEKLKTNMLVGTNIIMLKQLILDFSKKTVFIESYFCSFDIDIEILYAFI